MSTITDYTKIEEEITAVKRVVVLDTSVICSDPDCLYSFPGEDIVIPLTVIEELDHHKTRPDEVGKSARTALRRIEAIRVSHGGDIREARPLANDGTIRVETNGLHLKEVADLGLDPEKNDNRILAASLGQKTQNPHRDIVLVSNDTGLRIKAAQLGLHAQEHRRVAHIPEAGWDTLEVPHELVDELHNTKGKICNADILPELENMYPNTFMILRNGTSSTLVRKVKNKVKVLPHKLSAFGLEPRHKEQTAALTLLLDENVKVVALDGVAGTGKTLMAVAAGLEQVVENKMYDKVAIYRPIVSVGKSDVGFLPGGLDEKLSPWMAAITDAVSALIDPEAELTAEDMVNELTARNQFSMESVTFLRGRTLHRSFVIVDEAQNMEPNTLKTILTRLGEGSKVVFTGDQSQIDAPYLSEHNNALGVLTEAFNGQEVFGHVRLRHCERGTVASLAAELL